MKVHDTVLVDIGRVVSEPYIRGGSSILVDLNSYGAVDVRDAAAFGQIWRGEGDNSQAWQGSTLPDKAE